MKRILFPIDQGKSSIQDDDTRRMSKTSTTRWESLDPLEMATKIAMMAREGDDGSKTSPTLLERRSLPPLRIDTSFLSSETPKAPEIPDHINNMSVEKLIKSPQLGDRPDRVVSAYPSKRSTRSRDKHSPWDPCFLFKYNPDQVAARKAVQHLTILARQFETMESHEEHLSSYERMKTYLLDESSIIHRSNSSRHEKSVRFEKLYSSVFEQMGALIAMAKETSGEHHYSPVKTQAFSNMEDNGPTFLTNEVNVIGGEYSKKDFTEFMNNWLRDNWTNPYPDDDGLAEIAAMNGTSPTIVSNWLINARTRKWRPAIVKAYETRRPAEMLKEDSITIFDGKTVGTEKLNIVQP